MLSLAECNLCVKSSTMLVAATLALPTYAWPFSDDYMYLLCEAMPTNSALMHETYTVQMRIPSLKYKGVVVVRLMLY